MRSLAEGQLAQGDEVAFTKESRERAARLVREVDAPLAQPLQEDVRRDIHQLDLVVPLEDCIRHRLTHGHAGDLCHHIIEAFDVLHVERGVHVDAGVQQLEHILPALAVAAARGVGVRELIDQDERRLPRQRTVEVEFLQDASLVVDCTTGEDGESFREPRRLGAAMSLDHPDHDVHALRLTCSRGLEHGVGLPHARGRAKEQLQLAPLLPRLLLPNEGEEGIRIG